MTAVLFPIALIDALVLVPVSLVQLLYIESFRLRSRELPLLELFKESLMRKSV